jgi:hypothetical protein
MKFTPAVSVAEEKDDREGKADCGQATEEDGENAASERTLARCVRGHHLRAFHVIVVRRTLDVIERCCPS